MGSKRVVRILIDTVVIFGVDRVIRSPYIEDIEVKAQYYYNMVKNQLGINNNHTSNHILEAYNRYLDLFLSIFNEYFKLLSEKEKKDSLNLLKEYDEFLYRVIINDKAYNYKIRNDLILNIEKHDKFKRIIKIFRIEQRFNDVLIRIFNNNNNNNLILNQNNNVNLLNN